MMALHDELVQRMKTVADSDTVDTVSDDDDILSIVVFQPSNTDPDLGKVEVQRIDPDRLPAPRPQNAEKKPAVASQPSVESRAAVRSNDRGSNVSRSGSSVGPVPRGPAQLLLCINKYGDKPGELKDPLGVACLPGGEIVVSEWGNKRLQVFDSNGKTLRLIAPGQVHRISHLIHTLLFVSCNCKVYFRINGIYNLFRKYMELYSLCQYLCFESYCERKTCYFRL